MQTTYTIKTKMPFPTVGMRVTSSILVSYQKDCTVEIDTVRTKAWLGDVAALVRHPSVLFATMIEGEFQISLTDEAAAKEFHAKWGGAA
ncbi:hypothetical protein DM806_13655 [Sphingobium lactosutens]|uniref:hypothetical protein n=1 Tax=Sphingobium lactosutens TaxID=522773 RepID=UPI0015B8C9F2|nr:hypothetical protein [Sphingobium lactosutens]NWK96686.1 hypothetical protein [Sphingobium lactosutens]